MNAIQEALTEYKIPNAWWPTPFINALQRIDITLTIPWVASCLLDFLSHEQHDNAALITDRIQRAVTTTSPEDVQNMLDEYDSVLCAFRDNFLLSYRHFIQAKRFLLSNELTGLRTQLAWALIFLGDCDYSRRNNIQYVIDSFSKIVSGHPENRL